MKVKVKERFASGLPDDDDHPYRSGPWRPQVTEYDAWDLEVEGDLPDDLAGTYLRNTENPLLPATARYHPFDGDGMLHSVTFEPGDGVRYANRFVRTEGFWAEREAGRALWAGVAEQTQHATRTDGWGPKPAMKDASSTDVVVHNGVALTSFWLCGDLYQFDPVTLEQLGRSDFGGDFPAGGVSAHSKVDPRTGELLWFNYTLGAPYLHAGEVTDDGKLSALHEVPVPGPRLPHDMAFTENYLVLNDCPMFWDPGALEAGYHVPTFFPDLPTRFALVPRSTAPAEIQAKGIRWFEADPTFVLHWVNAYEDGDEVVLDGFFQSNPSPEILPDVPFEQNLFRYLDLHTLDSRPHRWRFNTVTGHCTEQATSDQVREFGRMNPTRAGSAYRWSYDARPCEGWFGFDGIVKRDAADGSEEILRLPDGVYASETVMAARPGGTTEDDGYLLTITMDTVEDRSECWVIDAANVADGPIARVSLPERVSSGTHATWTDA